MALSSIKIPEKVYIGFQGRRSQDEVPLGFMTPYTDDQAGANRRATVDQWARGYGREKTFNSVILENKPMVGFKIGRAIRRHRSWGGNASYVRIEDPRGFELEISIENLVMCMVDNIIDNGEIMAECVWGRDGNRNILLPTNSEPYKDSVATTAAVSAAISLRDVKLGDEIVLVTGETGIYCGAMYAIERYRGEVRISDAKRYVIKQTNNGADKVQYIGRASIKVSKVTTPGKGATTVAEIEREIAEAIKADPTACSNYSNTSYGTTLAWMGSNKTSTVTIREITMTEDETKELANKSTDGHYSCKLYVAIESNSGKIIVSNAQQNFIDDRFKKGRCYYKSRNGYNYYGSNNTVYTSAFIGKPTSVSTDGFSAYANDGYYSGGDETHIEESDVKRFFVLEKTFKSEKSGVEITVVI